MAYGGLALAMQAMRLAGAGWREREPDRSREFCLSDSNLRYFVRKLMLLTLGAAMGRYAMLCLVLLFQFSQSPFNISSSSSNKWSLIIISGITPSCFLLPFTRTICPLDTLTTIPVLGNVY